MASGNEQALLRVLIVGGGNIAGGFDQGRPAGELPYTHAGAFARDGRYCIEACVEPDTDRRAGFMKAWSVQQGFSSIDEVLEAGCEFDVVSICSPTSSHAHDLEIALRLKPRLIFCEKPVTTSLPETKRLVEACRKAGVLMAVNHTRRWDPSVQKLSADIATGRRGMLRAVTGSYNKGILNNGSHMLDLLHLLVGPLKIVSTGKPIHDYFPDDPTIPVWLEGRQELPVHLSCGHAEDYAFFELQLVFSSGILTMEEGGMYWRERRAVESDTFKGYRQLSGGERGAGEYLHAMLQAADNIYRALHHGEALKSTGETALSAQRMCQQIKQHAGSE